MLSTYYGSMKFLLTALLLTTVVGISCSEELSVHTRYLAVKGASPFPSQLWIRIHNEGYTSVPLAEKIKQSELLIDGQSYKRAEADFGGPEGLPLQGSWEGCLSLTDYVREGLKPGSHRLQIRIGNTLSEAIRIKAEKPAPAATETKERMHELEALRDALEPGMLRRCVENWLPEPDGGLQNPGTVRYFLEPDVKVQVSYEKQPPEERLKGNVRIYRESRVLD